MSSDKPKEFLLQDEGFWYGAEEIPKNKRTRFGVMHHVIEKSAYDEKQSKLETEIIEYAKLELAFNKLQARHDELQKELCRIDEIGGHAVAKVINLEIKYAKAVTALKLIHVDNEEPFDSTAMMVVAEGTLKELGEL